jgi:hypothetical protein
MHTAATVLAEAMSHAQHYTLKGQTHQVAVDVPAPALVQFFNSNGFVRQP